MPIFIDPDEWDARTTNMRKNDYSDHQILYGLRDRFRWHGLVDHLQDKGHTAIGILETFGNRLRGSNPEGLPDPELSLPSRYSSVDSPLVTAPPTQFDVQRQNQRNIEKTEGVNPILLTSPDQLTTADSHGESAKRWNSLNSRQKAAEQSLTIPWVDPISVGVAAFGAGTTIALNSGVPLLSAAIKGLSQVVPAAISDIPIGSVVSEFEQASDSPIASFVLNVALGALWGKKVMPSEESSIIGNLKRLFNRKGINVAAEDIENIMKPIASKRMQTDFERDFLKMMGDRAWDKHLNTVLGQRLRDTISASVGEKGYGRKSRRIGEILHVFIDSRNNPEKVKALFSKLTPEQQEIVKGFQELQSEHGFIADRVSQQYGKIRDTELDEGVLHNSVENYVFRLWDRPFVKGTGRISKFFTATRSSRPRTFETILDGWAAKGKLKIRDGIDAMVARGDASIDAIQNRKLINHMAGMVDEVGDPIISFTKREGYKLADFPNFKLWNFAGSTKAKPTIDVIKRASEAIKETTTKGVGGDVSKPVQKLQQIASEALQNRGFTQGEADVAIFKLASAGTGEESTILKTIEKTITEKEIVSGVKLSTILNQGAVLTENGALLLKKNLFVKPEAFKRLNAMFGVSQLQGLPGIAEATRLNSELKSIRFMNSFFHGNAYLRSFYFGGAPYKGFVQDTKAGEGFMTSLSKLTPRGAIRSGRKAWLNSGPEVELLIRTGWTGQILQDWQDTLIRQESTRIGQMLDQVKATKYAKDVVLNLRNQWNDFIFKEIGAPLKMRLALIELRSIQARHPELDLNKSAEMVSNFANDDFGGLNLARLGIDPTVWHGLRLVSLAPDWNLSNIRTMVNATKSGAEGQLYRHFWARAISKIVMLNLAVGGILAAASDEQMTANYQKAWKEGKLHWLDIDFTSLYKLAGGTEDVRKYFSSAGHFKDPIKYAAAMSRSFFAEEDQKNIPDISRVLNSKTSILYKMISEFVSGEDWMGRNFTTPEELVKTGETTRPSLTGLSLGIPKTGLIERTPSFILNRMKGSLPIPVENYLSWWTGEMEGFDALLNGVGANVSSEPYYTPDRKRDLKKLRKEFKKLHRKGITR